MKKNYPEVSTSTGLVETLRTRRWSAMVGMAAILTTVSGCGEYEASVPPTVATVEELVTEGCEVDTKYDVTGYAIKVDEDSRRVGRPYMDPISGGTKISFSEVVTSKYNLYPTEDKNGEFIIVVDEEGSAYLPLPIVNANSSDYSEKIKVTGNGTEEEAGRCVISAEKIEIVQP